jgi:hypothetical protein
MMPAPSNRPTFLDDRWGIALPRPPASVQTICLFL